MKRNWAWLGMAAFIIGSLAGCGGGGGDSGTGTTPPPAGGSTVTLPPALTGTATTVDYSNGATLFPTITPEIAVGGASVNSAPVIAFSIGDGKGNPYAGFENIKSSDNNDYPNFAFAIAKLVPGSNGSPSKWVSYMVINSSGTAPQRPSSERTGKLEYLGQGIYQYTFSRDITQTASDVAALPPVTAPNNKADLGDLTFDPGAVHRITIQFYGDAPGTGSNTPDGSNSGITAVPMRNPVNAIYDFIPATGKAVAPTDAVTQRLIVDKLSCNECHAKLGGIPGTEGASFHGGSRFDPKYCVVCHTDQRKYGRDNVTSVNYAFPGGSTRTYVADGVTVGDFPVLIHRVHKGELLIKQNYNFAGVLLNETKFPQDIRNCTKCHDNTAPKVAPQATNFETVPSRLACGACHDGIDFATGLGMTNNGKPAGHIGGIQNDDSKCALCHDAVSIKTVYHVPVTPPDPNSSIAVSGGSPYTNAAWIASNLDNLPPGAIKVAYDIQNVYRNTSLNPVIVFRMLQNGTPVPFNNPASATELWDGFFGGPSLYFVWAEAQDGIAAPADFNKSANVSLRGLWNGTATGTLTGPDANGYYTATLTAVTVPDGAVMLTGGVGYTYNLSSNATNGNPPLTQIGVSEFINSNIAWGTPRFGVSQSTIFPTNPLALLGGLVVVTPDMQMVATAGSANGGTGGAYTGRRPIVDDAKCDSCHQQLGLFTTAEFHAGQRNDATTCAWCHTPNRTSSGWSADSSYFVHAIHAADKRSKPFVWHASSPTESFADIGYPGILNKCETCHLPGTYDFSAPASASAVDKRLYRTAASGTLSSASASSYTYSPYITTDVDYGSTGAATNLVNSPTATACFACHDSDIAKQHMEISGNASLYLARSTATGRAELCLFCHDASSPYGLGIKAVHDK